MRWFMALDNCKLCTSDIFIFLHYHKYVVMLYLEKIFVENILVYFVSREKIGKNTSVLIKL